MDNTLKVLFFLNGSTGVFKDGNPVPKLQKSWLLLYAAFLKEEGVDLNEVEFMLPSGSIAKVFKTSEGNYNWRFINEIS